MRITIFLFLLAIHFPLIGQDILIFVRGNELLTFNPTDNSTSLVANFSTSFNDISLHPDGNLYGLRGSGEIHILDRTNGTTTLIYDLNHNPSQTYTSMTCSADGTLYIAALDGDLVTYNVADDNENFLGTIDCANSTSNCVPEGDLTFLNGELYVGSTNGIVLVNMLFPSLSTEEEWFTSERPIWGIVTDFIDCDTQTTYAMTGGSSPSIFYELDITNETFTELDRLNLEVFGATSEDEFRASDDIQVDLTNTTDATCETGGELQIEILSGIGLEFRVEGVNEFSEETTISDLPPNTYTLTIRDDFNCEITEEFTIGGLDNTIDIDISEFNETCTQTGRIEITINAGEGLEFRLSEDEDFSSETTISDLAVGDYTLMINNEDGCTATADFSILSEIDAFTISIETTTATCASDGSLDITILEGENLEFQVENVTDFDESTSIDNLPAGDYVLVVKDATDCIQRQNFSIQEEPNNIDISIVSTNETCQALGSIVVTNNSTEDLEYQLNDGLFSSSNSFTELPAATYTITARETATDCIVEREITIENECIFTPSPDDIITVPEAFLPNGNGSNEIFKVLTTRSIIIESYQIFDRWGNVVFSSSNFSSNQFDFLWNGLYENDQLYEGAFLYHITYEDGDENGMLSGISYVLR